LTIRGILGLARFAESDAVEFDLLGGSEFSDEFCGEGDFLDRQLV
jgi:hypothetical protein